MRLSHNDQLVAQEEGKGLEGNYSEIIIPCFHTMAPKSALDSTKHI